MKIVVVGNGPSVLKRNLEKTIDSCDIVIRLNSFKTKGFEKHVGSKTTIWANGTLNWENIKLLNQYQEIFLLYPLLQYYFQRVKKLCLIPIQKYNLNVDDVKKFFVPNIEFIESCYKRAGYPIEPNDKLHPSTGLFAIYLALSKFQKHLPIYITGFDCFKNVQNRQPTPHYFEPEQADLFSPFMNAHPTVLESSAIEKLIQNKQIKLL
jgi:hypothetical protein